MTPSPASRLAMLETDRFWSHVIRGPRERDCWVWVGAIADDGYGRFWVKRDGRQRALRPQRYAYELITCRTLDRATLLMHACDVPLCVHADLDPTLSHLGEGTHRTNMIDRSQKGRFGNQATSLWLPGLARTARVQRSRELRRVLLEHGWDIERIAAALAGVDKSHPRLF